MALSMTARLIVSAVILMATACGNDRRAAQIDALMHAYTGKVPGAAVLVLQDGQPQIRRGYGESDLEAGVDVGPATNFRLASMTKQFTAAAILLLAEDGRLSLDDPARKYLPLPEATQAITLRQMLQHTSGLIDYEDLIPAGTTAQLHDADVLRLLASENRTYFAPGTRYRYSDSGYSLLSLIVAKVSGRDFATFLHDRIFAPLQMRDTVAFEAGVSTVTNRAFGYGSAPPWTRTDQSLTSAVLGDGGVYSSIDDLAKWDAALYDDRLLQARWRRLAFSGQIQTDDPAVKYGLGWRTTGESVWHSGETVGFRNVIVRFPMHHFTVIVLTNRDDGEPYFLALQIAKLYVPDADAVHAASSITGPDPHARTLPDDPAAGR